VFGYKICSPRPSIKFAQTEYCKKKRDLETGKTKRDKIEKQ
jgi:hypothetical protein